MIARIWHGWTTPANADAYERLLRTEIFPGILARKIVGFRNIQMLKALCRPRHAPCSRVSMLSHSTMRSSKRARTETQSFIVFDWSLP